MEANRVAGFFGDGNVHPVEKKPAIYECSDPDHFQMFTIRVMTTSAIVVLLIRLSFSSFCAKVVIMVKNFALAGPDHNFLAVSFRETCKDKRKVANASSYSSCLSLSRTRGGFDFHLIDLLLLVGDLVWFHLTELVLFHSTPKKLV